MTTELLSGDPAIRARLEQEAISRGDDAMLIALREQAAEERALPRIIDGVRRGRAVTTDSLSTTWEGWEVSTGVPVLLRLLRARWRDDTAMRMRLAQTITDTPTHPVFVAARFLQTGDWPHLRWRLPGPLTCFDAPIEDGHEADVYDSARLLTAAISVTRWLDEHGVSDRDSESLGMVRGEAGLRFVWLNATGPETTVPRLRRLTQMVRDADPLGLTPAGRLAEAWSHGPLPDAPTAASLWRRAMADHLTQRRHLLARIATRSDEGDRARVLHRHIRALATALPPPTVTACLRANADGQLVVIWSDGQQVRAGACADAVPAQLPLVWSRDKGLAARPARVALRAWRSRSAGDTELRAAWQQRLQSSDETTELLIRWLAGQATLNRSMRLVAVWRDQLRLQLVTGLTRTGAP